MFESVRSGRRFWGVLTVRVLNALRGRAAGVDLPQGPGAPAIVGRPIGRQPGLPCRPDVVVLV